MGLLSRIQQFLTDINHLGVGDEQDIALPLYDPGTLHGRQVRQASPSVNCATGIIQRIETHDDNINSIYYPGLRGITGCVSNQDTLGLNYDGYETISFEGTTLRAKGCKVQPDSITVNDTITVECQDTVTVQTTREVAQRGGFPNGACHPKNMKKKLDEFAYSERNRCYPPILVPGFNHPQVDCATGIIKREGAENNPGLRGITGCYSDRGLSDFQYDGYIHYIRRAHVPSERRLDAFLCKVQQDPITVNDNFTFDCTTYYSHQYPNDFDLSTYEDIYYAGWKTGGICHPNNMKTKLDEFARIERQRCYPNLHIGNTTQMPTASPTGTDYQATNLTNTTTPPTKDDKAGFISSTDAPSNLGYLGFLVAPIGLGIVAASLGVYAAYRWWTGSEKPEPNEPTEIPMSEIQIEKGTDIPHVVVSQHEKITEVNIPG